MISRLPGKASRTLVDLRGFQRVSICILEAKPGKFDIKRREPGILFISFSKLIHSSYYSDYDVNIDFLVNSMSLAMSFKTCNDMMT